MKGELRAGAVQQPRQAAGLVASDRGRVDRKPLRVGPVILDVLPDAISEVQALQAGLLAARATIAPKYFYDARGCALFAEICRLPEYYLTRTETAILDRHRGQIAAYMPTAVQWVELGCGDGAKSRPWLDVTAARRFVGVDIAYDSLATTVATMAYEFSWLECLGIATDLSQPLRLQQMLEERPTWPPVFFYAGSSIGNFTPAEALVLLCTLCDHLNDGGCLLIGVDLVKDEAFLEAAYDDAQGVTAAFNRNILNAANDLLGADFNPDAFEHCAFYAAEAGRVEMHLRAREPQTVRIGDQIRQFARGETILTEYSHKYTVEAFVTLLGKAGFSRQHIWTDERGWFSVFLAQP
jgi:dimethylhistidine N-methyltransferase